MFVLMQRYTLQLLYSLLCRKMDDPWFDSRTGDASLCLYALRWCGWTDAERLVHTKGLTICSIYLKFSMGMFALINITS